MLIPRALGARSKGSGDWLRPDRRPTFLGELNGERSDDS
jgi:hypothetical protein